ncbi:cupredoxin domain-containing protein [Candidatus Roizmanbacteria bacterium]|nr:cupredoxin domain-containing protein [Candidatus Roizmanbacteria bacterium]
MAKKGVLFPLLPFFLVFFLFLFALIAQKQNFNNKKDTDNLAYWVDRTKSECRGLVGKEILDTCYRKILRAAVREEGTARAVLVLQHLRDAGVIDAKFDDHQHVHEIGRATAKLKGLNSEAFLMCPSTYNYGCQHGFFEYALSKTNSYKEAATTICENIKDGRSPKLYSYCYHGVGHGLMMALAYDLQKSLDVCNQFPNQTAKDGCWQGSFMENSNAAVTDEDKVLGFSKDDPLAPCDKVEGRYVWQCYINHAGYLMKVTNLNLKKAVDICLSSPNNGKRPCIQSIGLMTTNPIWQKSMRGIDTINDPRRNVQVAWEMCQEMPLVAQEDCVIGAIGNIHNFDGLGIGRSSLFCSLVNGQYKNSCYSEIGRSVAGLVRNPNEADTICAKLQPESGRISCLQGVQTRKAAVEPQTETVAFDESRLIQDDNYLLSFVKKFSPSFVVEKLSEIMPKRSLSCHDRAHVTGRFAYKIYRGDAFKLCSSQCHSGCYHGATEAFFNDKGTANLEKNLAVICQGQLNRFFRHQCIHGVGHGLMAWSSYELFDALSSCNQLKTYEDQSSCWTGVFMENAVGGLSENTSGHYTSYISDNPQYPCNIVPEKYKGACYFLQTSRMVQLFGTDFKKISEACMGAPQKYRFRCFQSMGRDASGMNRQGVRLSIQACQNAPSGLYRTECLSGAAQDTFWDPKGKDDALLFCSLLKEGGEVRRCYETIAQRATEVLNGKELTTFCNRIPKALGVSCAQFTSIAGTSNSLNAQNAPNSLTSSNAVQSAVVTITDRGFSPKSLTVKRGAKVSFKNAAEDARWPASNIHPTHRIYPEFDPKKPVNPGETWSFVFQKAGIWRYHDHLFPSQAGTITVVE